MTSIFLELSRHKAWATLQLIGFLRWLPAELLERACRAPTAPSSPA